MLIFMIVMTVAILLLCAITLVLLYSRDKRVGNPVVKAVLTQVINALGTTAALATAIFLFGVVLNMTYMLGGSEARHAAVLEDMAYADKLNSKQLSHDQALNKLYLEASKKYNDLEVRCIREMSDVKAECTKLCAPCSN
jgi:hypothetical protein